MAVVKEILDKSIGITGATTKTIKDQAKPDSLYQEALDDDNEPLFNTEDYVHGRTNIDPTMHVLASVGRSLDIGESEQVKATNYGKAFLSGVTLNNYEYTPDDTWSAEGVTKMIGEVAPFYLLWQTGAIVGGRAVAALNYAMGGKRTQAAVAAAKKASKVSGTPSSNPFLKAGKLAPDDAKIAQSFQETWAGFIPQVGIEAGLWTAIDPTMEGAEGFKTAVAYTALGQTLGIGLNSYFTKKGIRTKKLAEQQAKKDGIPEAQGTDTIDVDNAVDAVVKTRDNEEVAALQKAIIETVDAIDNKKKALGKKSNELVGDLLRTDSPTTWVDDIPIGDPPVGSIADEVIPLGDPPGVMGLTSSSIKAAPKASKASIAKTEKEIAKRLSEEFPAVKKSTVKKTEAAYQNLSPTKKAEYNRRKQEIEAEIRAKYDHLFKESAEEYQGLRSSERTLRDMQKSLDPFGQPVSQTERIIDMGNGELLYLRSSMTPAKLRKNYDDLAGVDKTGAPISVKKITTKDWTANTPKENPKTLHVFGDNLKDNISKSKSGGRGNSAIVRGNDNAVGIVTKKEPNNNPASFYTDADYDTVAKIIDEDLTKIEKAMASGKYDRLEYVNLGGAMAKIKNSGNTKKLYKLLRDTEAKLDAYGKTADTPIVKKIDHNYDGINDRNTNLLIADGVRTQTTRNDSSFKAEVGDIIKSSTNKNDSVVYIQITKKTKGYDLNDFKKQGYASKEQYKARIGTGKGAKSTYDFVVVDAPASTPGKPTPFGTVRSIPKNPYAKKLIARNHYQTIDTDVVVAVGRMQEDAVGIVKGGTGWAVQAAKRDKKPLFFWDMDKKSWQAWNYEKELFEPVKKLNLSSYEAITGVGTKDLDKAGADAIKAASSTISEGSVLKSGGAKGSDNVWEQQAVKAKAEVTSYIAGAKPDGQRIPGVTYKTITDEEFAIGIKASKGLLDKGPIVTGPVVPLSKMTPEDQATVSEIIKSNTSTETKMTRAVDPEGGFDNPNIINYSSEMGPSLGRTGEGGEIREPLVAIGPNDLVPVEHSLVNLKIVTHNKKIVVGGVVYDDAFKHIAGLTKEGKDIGNHKYYSLFITNDVDVIPFTDIVVARMGDNSPVDIVDMAAAEHVFKPALYTAGDVRTQVRNAIDNLERELTTKTTKGKARKEMKEIDGVMREVTIEPSVTQSAPETIAKQELLKQKSMEFKRAGVDMYKSKVNSVDDRNKIAHFIFKAMGIHTNDYMRFGRILDELIDLPPGQKHHSVTLVTEKADQLAYIKKGYDNLSVDEKAYFRKKYTQLVEEYDTQIGTELDRLSTELGLAKDKVLAQGGPKYKTTAQGAQAIDVLNDTEDILFYLEQNAGKQATGERTTRETLKVVEGTKDPLKEYSKKNKFVLENLGWGKGYSNINPVARQVIEDVYLGIKRRHGIKKNMLPEESLKGLVKDLEFQGMNTAAARLKLLLEDTKKWPEALKRLKQQGYLDLGELSKDIVGEVTSKGTVVPNKESRLHLVLFDQTIRNKKFSKETMESVQFIPKADGQPLGQSVNYFYKQSAGRGVNQRKALATKLEQERKFAPQLDADGNVIPGKYTDVEISTQANRAQRKALADEDAGKLSAEHVGELEAYAAIQDKIDGMIDTAMTTLKHEFSSSPKFKMQNTPLSKELILMIDNELNNLFSQGGHGNLNAGIILKDFKEMLKKKGITIETLPNNPNGITKQQKQKVRDLMDTINKQVFGVSIGIKGVTSAKIIEKQAVIKKFVAKMDEYTGYDSKSLVADHKKLQQQLKDYEVALRKNNLMESGTEESLNKVLTGMEGLDTLLKNTAVNKNQTNLSIVDSVTYILKENKTGVRKQSKYPINNIDTGKLKTDIEDMFNARKQLQKFDDLLVNNYTYLGVQVPEMKAIISRQFSKIIKNDIASWMQDGTQGVLKGLDAGSSEQLKFKQRFKLALDSNDTTAQANIKEEFIKYLTGNEEAFIRISQELNYMNRFPTELYYIHRAAQGLEPNLNKAIYFRRNTESLNDIKFADLMDTIENTAPRHPEVDYVKKQTAEATSNVEDRNMLNRANDNYDGPPADINTGPGGDVVSAFADYIWKDPKRKFLELFKRYADPVFLSVVDNMQYASRQINDFLNIGDTQFIKGPNMKSIVTEPGKGMSVLKDEVIADPNWPNVKTEKDFDRIVGDPALKQWKQTHEDLSNIASDVWFDFKEEIINKKLWSELDDMSFSEFLRRATDQDPTYRIPEVARIMRKFLLGPKSKLYIDQTKRVNTLTKEFGAIPGNELAAEYLKRIQNTLKTVRDTVTNQGRKEANTYIDGLLAAGKISKKQHERMTRKMVGDIPGYMPMFVDGPIMVQIKHYKTDKLGNRVVDMTENLGTVQNTREADALILKHLDNGDRYKAESFKESQLVLINQPSNSTLDPGKFATDELDMVAQTSLGNIGKFIERMKGGKKYDGTKISEYVGSHSMQRQFDQNLRTSTKSIEEMVQRYAYSQGKDGFFAKSLAELEYAKIIADNNGHLHTREYLERWGVGAIGGKTNLESGVDNAINKVLVSMQKFPKVAAVLDTMGMSPGTNRFRALTQTITKMSSFVALGFNAATAALQLTIAGTNILPLVGFKNLTRAYPKITKVIHPPKGGHKTLEMQNYEYIFDYLDLRGVKNDGTIQGIHQNANQKLIKDPDGWWIKAKKGEYKESATAAGKAMMDLSMWMFHKADRAPRMLTAIAARDMADDVLKRIHAKMKKFNAKKIKVDDKYVGAFDADPFNYLKFNERIMYEKMQRLGLTSEAATKALDGVKFNRLLNDFAIDFTNATNHSYNATNVPLGFTETGLRPFLQFKTWVQKQSMFWFNIITDKPTKAGMKEQYEDLMYVTAAMAGLGGIFSIPGAQESDFLMRKIFGVSPKAWLMEQDSQALDLLTSGMAMGAGISFEGRMGPGNLLDTMEPGNIAGIYPARLFKAGGALWGGNPERALNYTIPKALQNLRSGFTLANTGELRGTYDKNLLLDYNRLEDDKYYAALLKTVGFENMAESRYRNLKFALLDKSRFTGKQRAWTKNEIFDLINDDKIDEAKALTKQANMKWKQIAKLYKQKFLLQDVETFNYTYSDQNPEIKKGQEALKRIIKSLE